MNDDPLLLAQGRLRELGVGAEMIEARMWAAREEVAAALASAEAAPWPAASAAFEDVQDTGSGRWFS